jgi:hypothetical protein
MTATHSHIGISISDALERPRLRRRQPQPGSACERSAPRCARTSRHCSSVCGACGMATQGTTTAAQHHERGVVKSNRRRLSPSRMFRLDGPSTVIGVIYPFAEAAPRLHEGLPNLHLSGSILLESAGERAAHRNIDRTRREGLSDRELDHQYRVKVERRRKPNT